MTEETKKVIKKIYGISDEELDLISFVDVDLTPNEEESLRKSVTAEMDGSTAVVSSGSVVVSNVSAFLLSFPSVIGAAVHDSMLGILRYAKTLTANEFRRFDAGASAIAMNMAEDFADNLASDINESKSKNKNSAQAKIPLKEKGDDPQKATVEGEKWKA